jgi:hypothetical protein
VEQRRALVLADPEIAHQLRRKDVGESAERDRLRRRMTDGSRDAPAGLLGEAQRFLGESRLADTRRTDQDDARRGTLAEQATEPLELGRPPRQWPWSDRHSSGR